MNPVILIGVCGGSASGKTSLCQVVGEALGVSCRMLSMDAFYKGLTADEIENVAEYNFDHPNAIDFDDIYNAIQKLLNRESVEIPVYDFAIHARLSEGEVLQPADLILYEGIHAFYDERVRSLMNMMVFV
jgi:uridine kinase